MPELVGRCECREINLATSARDQQQQRSWHARFGITPSESEQPVQQLRGTAPALRGPRWLPWAGAPCRPPRITMSSRRFGGSDQPRRSATASVRATASSGERVPPSPARSERVSACCSCPMRPCHSEMGATLREMETRTEQGGDGAQASRFCALVTANDSKCGQLCLESEPSGSVWSRRCYMPDPNTKSRNAAGTWKLGPPVGDHAAKITSSCGRAAPRGRLMR